jgi:outer membrane protein OmpA-like peptidoglycan-associated protein
MTRSVLVGLLAIGVVAPAAPAANSQLGNVRRAVVREVEKKAEDVSVNAVRCVLGDERCVRAAKAARTPVVITDQNDRIITDATGVPVTDQVEAAKLAEQPGHGVWRNYDFVPGTTVWKATDFSSEPVGRFPARQLEFISGNMQIVEFEGAKVLEATSASVLRVPLPQALPPAFTIEFSLRIPAPNFATQVFTSPRTAAIARHPHDYVSITHTPGIYRAGRELSATQTRSLVATTVPVKLQVRDDWAIMYVGSDRVSQVPTANFGRGKAVEFHLTANARFPAYLSAITVAVGLDSLYDALMASGEFTTRGILFDTDSAVLRPESTPALEMIASALTEHADLRVQIEGHTDSVGDEAHNQGLSQRRAAAVVAYLVAQGIAGTRLTAVGKGESVPAADNDTLEGRQQNRRVVIRRLS